MKGKNSDMTLTGPTKITGVATTVSATSTSPQTPTVSTQQTSSNSFGTDALFSSNLDNIAVPDSVYSIPITSSAPTGTMGGSLFMPSYLDSSFVDNIFSVFENAKYNAQFNPSAMSGIDFSSMSYNPFGSPVDSYWSSTSSRNSSSGSTDFVAQRFDTSRKVSPSQYDAIIEKYSKEYGVDPNLIRAMMRQESGGKANAVSSVGASGLMQLMPDTARAMGVKDIFDPEQNIAGGIKYMAQQLKKYNGNVNLALAAYNAGPGAVDKYNGIPPYKETKNYVATIMANYTKNQS